MEVLKGVGYCTRELGLLESLVYMSQGTQASQLQRQRLVLSTGRLCLLSQKRS